MLKLIIISLLITSCAEMPRSRVLSSKRVTTYQVGVSCPVGYYYSFTSELCHQKAQTPKLATIKSIPVQVKPKVRKPLKTALNCSKVFKEINQCMGGI